MLSLGMHSKAEISETSRYNGRIELRTRRFHSAKWSRTAGCIPAVPPHSLPRRISSTSTFWRGSTSCRVPVTSFPSRWVSYSYPNGSLLLFLSLSACLYEQLENGEKPTFLPAYRNVSVAWNFCRLRRRDGWKSKFHRLLGVLFANARHLHKLRLREKAPSMCHLSKLLTEEALARTLSYIWHSQRERETRSRITSSESFLLRVLLFSVSMRDRYNCR